MSLPALFANLVEPVIGLLGDAWHRRALVRAGGVAFAGGLLLVASSNGFLPLLLALVLIYPAGGAFVGLAQASLMDAEPLRHELNMARWSLAGSAGLLLGPVSLSAAAAAGLGWRGTFAGFAVLSAVLLALMWRTLHAAGAVVLDRPLRHALAAAARNAARALRRREVLRWLTLLEFADLMLDVLHAYLALYFVDVAGVSAAHAGFAIAVWTGLGLAGDALLIPLLGRVEGTRYLRASAGAALIVFPAFLLFQPLALKLVLLGLLGLLNAGWYSILRGRLYSAMPGQSATVMSIGSVFGMGGALLPLVVGFAAERFGLGTAMWLLAAGPIALLVGLPARARQAKRAVAA
jgi:FSR family fosmidomycin resistance protein-like MFS transporter